MLTEKYLYDKNYTRFHLVKSVPGKKVFNFLFLPGGPGVDSSSLLDLINAMNISGNYWLIDLPGNGTNTQLPNLSSESFKKWNEFLVEAVSGFENPIIVGHSFSGYLPLFCPKLEKILKGIVIIGSASTLQSDLYAQTAKEHALPSLVNARQLFVKEQSLESLQALYMLEAEYFFTPEYKTKGINTIIKKLKFSIPAEYWWYTEGVNFYNKNITWVPQKVPTLIIGGSRDYITPLAIFENDVRFKRKNIKIQEIKDAGHFPWLEQTSLVSKAIKKFTNDLNVM